jgi:DNA-binding PadR family transcriptional regulator
MPAPSERLGGFEELVLLAVASLRGSGYGVTIQERLEAETGQAISVGAVYATLDRLERKDLLSSRVGPTTAERGGKRKRIYKISASGADALAESRRVRGRLWKTIESPARS